MARIASPTFIGRTAELAELDAALEAAAQGNPTAVLIGGDAGVGKTRLLGTWNERAVERGAWVVSGACLDLGESGPAYVAVLQAVRDLFASLDLAGFEEVVGTDRAILGRLMPELADDAGAGGDDAGLTPTAQTRLFHALVQVLERASSDRPLVLELEDIHWADPSTRAFLVYLVANARSGRLLIVATFRAEEAGAGGPVTSMFRQLGRHPRAERIDLQPFDPGELREQLRGILGEPPTKGLLASILTRSEGNALFAEELIASGNPAADLPISIGDALLSRTAGLSATAHLALRAASIAGRSTSYDLLRSATALADDRLDAALREAVALNILEAEAAGERFRFRHALLKEAIYQDTLPGERRRLHAAVAEALEVDGERPTDPELASRLAYHWFEANNHERALLASVGAGEAAWRQAAYAEALQHYARALDLWEVVPGAHADLRLVDILGRACRAAARAGEPNVSVTYGRRALDELDVTDDTILRVRMLKEITDALDNAIRDDEAIEYRRRLARIDAIGLPVRERWIVLASQAWVLRWDGAPAAARIAALEALPLADVIDVPEVRAEAHLNLAWTLFADGDFEGAIAEARRAGEFASVAGDPETEVGALSLVHLALHESGQDEMAVIAARATRAYADQVGLSEWEGTSAAMSESEALLYLGRVSESAEVIEAALLDPPANPVVLSQFHLLAAATSIIRGAYDDAAGHLEAARVPGSTPEEEAGRGWLATVRAELANSEERLDDVRGIVDTTAPQLEAAPAWSGRGHWIWGLIEIGLAAEASRAEAARAAGDEQAIGETRTVADRFLSYVEQVRRRGDEAGLPSTGTHLAHLRPIEPRHHGYEALIEGHLARIQDRDDPSLWVTAAEMFPPQSPRGLAARYRQAEAMLAARLPRDEIREVMANAYAIAVDIGARPLVQQFVALARRARIDLRPAAPAASSDDAMAPPDEADMPGTAALRGRGLSDREIEVLTLVSAGFSNQAIGDRLFITDKTASVHVSHILAKLGATSRTEAATIGVRLGLPDVERDDGAG